MLNPRSAIIVGCVVFSAIVVHAAEPMWIEAPDGDKDYYAAFRGSFHLDNDAEVEIRTLGANWFAGWIDGKYLTEGPSRFLIAHPEYEPRRVRLSAGDHVLAFQVHCVGEETRMLPNMPPFLWCEVHRGEHIVPVEWKAVRMGGYAPRVRRINPILGWIEWCDTRQIPTDWQAVSFDAAAWPAPVATAYRFDKIEPLTTGSVRRFVHALEPIAQGPVANVYGYETDDIPARFFLRDLTCRDFPPQGEWRRYDLGRVRLGKPSFTLDLPQGAIVEFAYAETLSHGRVAPYVNLSTGPSCNFDRYIARGGEQTFCPLTPKGGRYLEVHVLADPGRIRFAQETYIERCYHDKPEGSFTCDDELLNRIWMTGVETYRACAEDALVDNPTRERGQWTGDVVSVGMDIAAVAYADLRLLQRGLVQSAQCARGDGMVAGLSPGTVTYLATYACQWVTATMHHYELTGDRALLESLFPAAVRNISAFESHVKEHGLEDGLGWVFIDWGYVPNPGPADMAYNMHFLAALESMVRWCDVLGKSAERSKYEQLAKHIRGCIERWLAAQFCAGDSDRQDARPTPEQAWSRIGYHRAALALSLGMIEPSRKPACIAAIKRHMLDCFPNNPDAPRLADPTQANPRLITPYFAHYAFGPLIENGEIDFVLDQYRKCWGWMLEDDRTTWIEVYDTRWSHCHQWAGAPTWQLSRYVLGLHPRFDLGKNHFVMRRFPPTSLTHAEGAIPLPEAGKLVRIKWTRDGEHIRYAIDCDQPIWLHMQDASGDEQIIHVTDAAEWTISRSGKPRE